MDRAWVRELRDRTIHAAAVSAWLLLGAGQERSKMCWPSSDRVRPHSRSSTSRQTPQSSTLGGYSGRNRTWDQPRSAKGGGTRHSLAKIAISPRAPHVVRFLTGPIHSGGVSPPGRDQQVRSPRGLQSVRSDTRAGAGPDRRDRPNTIKPALTTASRIGRASPSTTQPVRSCSPGPKTGSHGRRRHPGVHGAHGHRSIPRTPHTPTDQAWIETFFGHVNGGLPHLEDTPRSSGRRAGRPPRTSPA